ncbi:MAG: hypothetical protein QXT53_05120 [Ignisphaera sp.]
MQKPRRLVSGISAVIGAVILIAIMVLFIALYIASIERFGTLSQEVISKVGSLQESSSTVRSVDASWSYNGTHTTIFIDNQASKSILVVSIAIVYRDGSYTIVSRLNKSINILVAIGNTQYRQLQLPFAIPPATQAVIAVKTGQEPATLSLAIEASPITTIIIPKKTSYSETFIVKLEPRTGNGTETWVGRVAIPIIRKGKAMHLYPISAEATYATINILHNNASINSNSNKNIYTLTSFYTYFTDLILFNNTLKAYKINITITFNTNTPVYIATLMNGTNISNYCNVSTTTSLQGFFTIACYYPIKDGVPLHLVNITLVLQSQQMFIYTIYNISASILGYFSDSLFDSLIVGLGDLMQIAFYNLSSISLEFLKPVFIINASSRFDGSTTITYDTQNYRLYMVNKSGIFSWDPLGWSSATHGCKTIGIGATTNIVGSKIVVFPGGYSNHICVFDLSTHNIVNVSLDGFKLYEYTSSAIYRDSIVFTALDNGGGVMVLLFNTTTGYVKSLWRTSMYSIAGVAVDNNNSRLYIVFSGVWKYAKIQCHTYQYVKIFVGSLKTGFSSYTNIPIQLVIQNIQGYGNRVGMYRNNILIIDIDTVLLIDPNSIGLTKTAEAYQVQ